MAKSCLGIDIGKDQLKLVLMKGENICRTASVQMPEGLFKEGRIVSVETTGELIRKTMKENRMRCKEAAVVVSSGICFLRNVTLPEMTPEQLVYNLPYEFRDYITDELKKYAFDYCWSTDKQPEPVKKAKKEKKKKLEEADEGEPKDRQEMELLAAAAPLEAIDDLRLMLRKAGLKLASAAPEVSACETLLHYKLKSEEERAKEYGILDIGSTSCRLLIFKGDHHQVTRVIDRGMEQVEEILADSYHIDVHLAHTWLLTNHEDCINSEACQDAFSQISVELMRALNFYQFSNPDSNLEDIWICGGGSCMDAMKRSLEENLDVNIFDAGELVKNMAEARGVDVSSMCLMATGAALSVTGREKRKQINLALAGQKKKHYLVAVPAIGGILVAAGLFGKFAVADRLAEVSIQQSRVNDLQAQVDDVTAYIQSFGDLQKTYAHLTYQGLTSAELACLNRPDVLDLLKNVILPKVAVSNWSLTGNQLTLPVTGVDLADINALVQQLDQEKLVDYCTVMTAATGESKEKGETVTGQIVIYLNDSIGDDAEVEEDVQSVEDAGAEAAAQSADDAEVEAVAQDADNTDAEAAEQSADNTDAEAAAQSVENAGADTDAQSVEDAGNDTATQSVEDASAETAAQNADDEQAAVDTQEEQAGGAEE